ncbi:MAG: hypothetical protein JSS96_16825, partial [Bacteroidetes bacterium]|nr:hypothetical protein [Bacteroidota bacterium]
MFCKYRVSLVLLLFVFHSSYAQDSYELNTGWKCRQISQVNVPGEEISRAEYSVSSWMPAIVPGTVLTTLLANKQIPDPYYGMNNERI